MSEDPEHTTGRQRPPGDGTDLQVRQIVRGARRGDQYIRITRHPDFLRRDEGILTPRRGVGEPQTPAGRLVSRLRRALFGTPIPSAEELTERVGVLKGLAIFATDNISSSAYATEEIMRVLALAGIAALSLAIPITATIVLLLAIVVISDLQVIRAYPGGGGSYIVATENLGRVPGLVAAAALLTDYTLTVAVSVSAGVAALTSAFPEIYERRVLVALAVVGFLTVVNMRGVREAGQVFAIPAIIYVGCMLGLLMAGLFQILTGTASTYAPPQDWLEAYEAHPLTALLVLRAFASGAVALTGVEAVSNGVPAFRPPEVRNAQKTLALMGVLFATIFVGLSLLTGHFGIVPDPHEVETVISQLARTLTGQGWFYYLLQFSTAVLLLLAANTAFNGFPRLASILAVDRFLPRQFSYRGDRLAFTGGITILAVVAALLIWIYEGSVTNLIPLYTVGVFVAFTLSQAGLVRRWITRRGQERSWRLRLATNSLGALATGAVAVIAAVTKFLLGAWMVLLVIPLLVWTMRNIRSHYSHMAEATEPETPLDPRSVHVRAIIPVANIDIPTQQAVAYAAALIGAERVVAVHITDEQQAADRFRHRWQQEVPHVPLVIIESPFRSLLAPLLAYIDAVHDTHPGDTLTVVMPEYVPRHWWEHLLHNQTALRIKAALLFHPGVVVTSIPYHVKR